MDIRIQDQEKGNKMKILLGHSGYPGEEYQVSAKLAPELALLQ